MNTESLEKFELLIWWQRRAVFLWWYEARGGMG